MADRNPNETPFQAKMRRLQAALDQLQTWQQEWSRRANWTEEEWARWGDRQAEHWTKWGDRQAEHWTKWGDRQAEYWSKWGEQYAAKWARKTERHAEHWRRREARRAWKLERKLAKRRWKQEMRDRHEPPLGLPTAVVFAVAAAGVAGMAVTHWHELWWLIFVALGLGQSAARIFERHHRLGSGEERRRESDARQRSGEEREPPGRREQEPAPAAQPAPANEADARVDAVCDKLLAEVRAGPNVLREVVRNPEQTVEALRKSCHDLARRERELRALYTPEDERRLAAERDGLAARVEAERDEVARGRLREALAALDAQRGQRAELLTAAARLGAEHTRLYYTLENLYAQVLRVRSADAASADVAGAGLRKSLEQLGEEMDAVAEALESVHRDEPRLEPISSVGDAGGGRAPGGRERA